MTLREKWTAEIDRLCETLQKRGESVAWINEQVRPPMDAMRDTVLKAVEDDIRKTFGLPPSG